MSNSLPRVVTLGGGHGQAVVLSALRRLGCEITAIISVADDGGCSGKLRQETGMPPPGDLRRCLIALAQDRELAERFDLRLGEPGQEGRSAGNLALSSVYRETGSLQSAVDWAAGCLGCVGRVVPASESPGVLVVYDAALGRVEGESNVEHSNAVPMVAAVHGATQANPLALEAISRADFILMGPGSFYTSTLSVITTGELALGICMSPAERLLLVNLAPEGNQTQGLQDADYLRVLGDHLTIASGGERATLAALRHAPEFGEVRLPSGERLLGAPLTHGKSAVHDAELLARAFERYLGLRFREELSIPPPSAVTAGYALDIEARVRAGLSSLGMSAGSAPPARRG